MTEVRDIEKQDTFDTVARALAAQGEPSCTPNGICALRDPIGRRCALGHLLKDDELALEHVDTGAAYDCLKAQGHSGGLLVMLQLAHDSPVHVDNLAGAEWRDAWAENMRSVAEREHLSVAVLEAALAEGPKL